MSSYFSNTEYHLESRREVVTGLHNSIEQGNRSALGTSVSFSLYNSEAFTQELNYSGSSWDAALNMNNSLSSGMYPINTATGKSSAFDNKLVLGLSQTVSSRTFSEFDANISNSLRDSRNSLKFVLGEAYRIDPSETKAYASQLVFENLFGSVLGQRGMYVGSNNPNRPDNYYLDQSIEVAKSFDRLAMTDKQSIEARGQETLDRLVYSDLFGGGLVPVAGEGTTTQDNVNSFYDNSFNNVNNRAGSTISDLQFIRSKSMTNELVSGNVSRTTRSLRAVDVAINNSYQQKAEGIIHDIKYQTRPGILPFVAMFEAANSSITIDSFQYQNKAISDVVISKIYREIITNKNYNFKVNMTVGSPVPGDDGTGAAIFGPNLIEVAKMQQLQKVITTQLKSIEVDQSTIDQVNSNFNIQLAGPAHHRKVYITDQVAVLGSINLTSPVGDSVFKAGSNFEMLGMFHSNQDLINNRKKLQYYNSLDGNYADSSDVYMHNELQKLSKKDGARTRSALMYEQVVAAQQEQAVTRSSQSNVKYATDIMYTLKATVDYLHKEAGLVIKDNNLENLQGKLTSDLSMTMVLDQAYLLHVNHLEDRSYRDNNNAINKNNQEMGEMGRFKEEEYKSTSFKSRQDIRYDMYKSIQKKNFTLVAMGITNIVVDPKNFRSQVIEPTWDFINLRLKNTFVSQYGGSIKGFVEGVTQENTSFGAKVSAINTALGITDTANISAYQILAIASGNISGANVPRQHAKAFEAKRSLGNNRYEGISAYTGSANLSMSNMGVGTNSRYLDVNGNDPYVTDEMGVVFINRNVFEQARDSTLDDDFKRNIEQLGVGFNSHLALEKEEEMAELKDASKAVVMSYNQLNYGNRIESGILQSIEGLPYWAKQTNTADLLKLESNLKQMSKGLGDSMSVNRKYDRFGKPIMLEVSINPSGLVGLNTASSRLTYTLTILQGDNNQPGPVFFQKEGKLIYNSNFTNTSGREIAWNFDGKKGRLGHGQSAEMSSIDNTTSIFATMIAEMAYKQTISNPKTKLSGISEEGNRSLMLDYTASVLGINRYLLHDTTSGKYVDGNTYSDYLFASGKHINLSFELASRLASSGINYLDSTRSFARIDVNSKDRAALRRHIQDIRSAKSGAEVYSHIDAISKMMGQKGFEDLALDVLRINDRYNAERDINSQMKELSNTIFDPYLQAHQAITYGAGVAASKLISYGIDATDIQALDMLELGSSSTEGVLSVLNFARTFARDVSVYSTFGFDGANERFYIGGVAEGVSTQNKTGYQLDSFGVRNKFPTDRNSLDILEGTGIGTLVSKERLLKRFTSDESDAIMSNLNISGKGILFNLDPNKPAQINQRIKNALGSRLMYEIDSEAANILKSGGTLKTFKANKIKEANEMLGMLVGLLGDDDKAKKFISGYLSAEEVGLASMYDTDVRTNLNESAYNYVIQQRKELFDVFKDLDLDEQQKTNVESALNYMFRMKMINNSFTPNTMGSVVGGKRDRTQFMILQLNGGYSDHFYLNPNFRTSYYAAPPTTTTTGIKASMLDSRTFVGQINIDGNQLAKDGFVIKEGDMFIYDKNINKVVQVKDGMSLSDGTSGNTYVGGSGSSDYLIGQIENFSLLNKPVASVKQRSTSNRPGEDSVQYILTAKKREGASSITNEIVFEVSVMNALQTGSGRRQEGTAASLLFKGVGAFIDATQFSNMFDSFKKGVSYSGSNSSVGVNSFNKMNASLSDVYGLINTNNLKSGFFMSHGAALLTTKVGNESMAKLLIKQDNNKLANKMLAAALVSQFGYDITSVDGLKDAKGKYIINEQAIKSYKKSALSGEFGTYLRILEMQRTISNKGISTADNIFGSIPQFILQDRELSKSINQALIDGGGKLSELLGSYVDKVHGFDEAKGYLINSSDLYTRGLTAILTAVDMFGQLKNQKGDMQFVTDWLLKTKVRQADGSFSGSKTNDPLVEIMAAIGGSSDAFTMSSSDKDELASMMGMYLQNNYAVALALNVLPSQSKDPLGKNLRAKTEMQHLLNPLYAQSKQFTKTGNKNNLAFVLGTIFAAHETNLISLGMADSKEYLNSIQHVNALDPTTVSGFFGHRFLGLYYNANSNTKELITQYKKIYSNTIRKDFDPTKIDMYLEDGSLTLAEATYVDRNVALPSRNNTQLSYTERLRNLGDHITAELKQEAIKYNIEESKGMGTDITAPKLQVLQEMGSRTFNILMPEIVGNAYVNEITGDHNYVFSNTQSKYIFMPGAELLNQVGSSFGDFVSDIVGKSINLYSYFTPGTMENDLLKKIASAKLQQGREGKYSNFNINLSVEESKMLARLYNLGDELLQSIVEASSDTLMQKAVSGHGTEFDGYVSTPIPNMALNYNMNLMPSFVNDRYGAPEAIANVRKQWMSVTTEAHLNYTSYSEEINKRFKNYRQAEQVKSFTKTMGVVLDYQRHMLVQGLSQPAISKLINKGGALEAIEESHTLINELQNSKDRANFDTSYIDNQLNKYQKSLSKINNELKNTGAYDEAYVASYIVANLQFAKIKADYYKLDYSKISDKGLIKDIDDWMTESFKGSQDNRNYKNSIYLGSNHEIRDFIHNSSDKFNEFRGGLDLANYYGAEMEGAMRGKHTVYRPVNDSIKELIDVTAKNEGFKAAQTITSEYINKRIDNLKSFTENFAPTSEKNAKAQQEHFLVNENRKSVGRMISDMEDIRDQVISYEGTDRRFLQHSLVELGFIHNGLSQLDNMQNNSWRSAPFGSTESHLGTLMAVRGIDQFNKMMTTLTDDKDIVRFDTEKGKSLSMFSGLSYLTSNLGDFDGDNYITLMHKVTEKIHSIDDRQLSISLYKKQLSTPYVLNSVLSPKDYKSLELKVREEENKLQEDAQELKNLQIDLNKSGQQGKMAKDIAAYMGIDSRFFRGADEGGFRAQGTLAVSSMSALLEQGKGLYGGLNGVSSDMDTTINRLLDSGGPAAGLKFDKDSLTTMMESLNDSKEASRIFTALGMDASKLNDSDTEQKMKDSLREAMEISYEHLQSNMDRDLNQHGEVTTEKFYQALVGKVHATTKAQDALSKVENAGLGIAMGESTYDVLTKTLGKAGSDVLGKTYNTLLGTFVADSPIVSLYHMLEGNREQIAEQMNKGNYIGPINDPANPVPLQNDHGTKFMANLQAAYDKAQDLQGWNKSVQQMLRDSIKLKGDSTSVMNKLTELSKDYDEAAGKSNSEEIRAKLIDDMAAKIGPGAGMKGLMNLNKMIHNSDKGNYGSAEEDYHLIGGERDIAQSLVGVNENALIKYKVSNQLRSITTMFNFEKNYGSIDVVNGELKIDNKASSNRALEQTIVDGLHGFLGKEGGTNSSMLLLAEHATGSRDRALELTNKLYSSVESFNKLAVNHGRDPNIYGVPLSESDRDKGIVAAFNHFAAELIGHRDGALGIMLGDHADIEMNDSNRAKLNEARQEGGLSTAALLVHSHYQSIVQTKHFMGDYGDGLDRFVHLNRASQIMQKNITQGLNEVGTNLLGSDLFNAAYRLMAQGKLSVEGGSVMNKLFKAVNDPNMTNADAMGKMLSNFSGDEDNAKELAQQYEHLKHVQIEHESGLSGVNNKKETVGNLIEDKTKRTSQGFKLQAIAEIAAAMRDSGDMSAANYRSIYSSIKSNNNLTDEAADRLANDLLSEQGMLLGSLTQEGKDYFKPTVIHRGSGTNTSTESLKAQAANGVFNIVGPALLSMLGGAIYGTSKDEAGMDASGIIGGTLSLMGFNMPHGKGAGHVAGALFRSKAYNNPDEDWATNMAKAASTELSMGLVGQFVTPKLTEVFNKNIVAPLVRNNLAIAESGVSAIIGSFVGSIVTNMLDSTIQQSAGLLKDTKFNNGDNNLNSRLAQLQDNLSDVIASRGEAELDPMSADRFIDITDKLDMPPLVVGVWATDSQIESMMNDNSDSSGETYLVGGQEGYV